jgi:hypothetical protein
MVLPKTRASSVKPFSQSMQTASKLLVALRKKKVGNYHYGVLRLGNTIDLWEHLFGDKLC